MMPDEDEKDKSNEWPQWLKVGILLLAAGIHWGTLSTKIGGVKESLTDIKADVSSIRGSTADLGSRVSYIEGKIGSRKETSDQ